MKLNTEVIEKVLKQDDRSVAWLARQIGVSQPSLYFRLKNKLVVDADKIASILRLRMVDVLIDETD